MIDRDFAESFAKGWIESWNSHDLDRILSHYSDDFEMSSPYIAQIVGEASGVLKGKAAIGDYWRKALARIPELHFELLSIYVGADSMVIQYRGHRGTSAEVFFFGEDNKVVKSAAHYS
jgi:ketosteroid isomerase-like protein